MRKFLSLLLICALVLTFAGCSKPCEDLELSKDSITFTRKGQTKGLNVSTDPKNTTDEIVFESDDEDVATVDEDGLVRAEGPGETTIIIRCGDEVAYCDVICDFTGDSDNDPDGPDGPDGPGSVEDECDTCDGTRICQDCDGNYKCQECEGSGDCPRCDGEDEITCRTCDGEPSDKCKECGGDGVYEGTYGNWDCPDCEGGNTCSKCDGRGVENCPDCDNGYCPECDGEKIVCDECNNGKCPDCD